MYSELIYTRCGQGIDILRDGAIIPNQGYKVYSCSQSLLKGKHQLDLQFLLDAVQTNQPNNAYLYYIHEIGKDGFMINFHKVDSSSTPNYRGCFLDQAIIGDYKQLYPFELFENNSIWNAKQREHSYYYDNPPPKNHLESRTDINNAGGNININNIYEFINDGRQEALKSAVAFLIYQYQKPPEERKYLVIKDETTKNIKLWIAAIESAFSPKIAAAIPFATQMNDFTESMQGNLYTVNERGIYQQQINLQDKNQKIRYRAMIIGLLENDSNSTHKTNTFANSDFVVLDGTAKKAMFEVDIQKNENFFKFITRFDDKHQIFCHDFLQSSEVLYPSEDIFKFFTIYRFFKQIELPNFTIDDDTVEKTRNILSILNEYKLSSSNTLEQAYDNIQSKIPEFLQQDICNTLDIIKLLQNVATIIDKPYSSEEFTQSIYQEFKNQIFTKLATDRKLELWNHIKESIFFESIAYQFVDLENNESVSQNLEESELNDWLIYLQIFIDCDAKIGGENIYLKAIVWDGLNKCYNSQTSNNLFNRQN